jgi:hypothetical protein
MSGGIYISQETKKLFPIINENGSVPVPFGILRRRKMRLSNLNSGCLMKSLQRTQSSAIPMAAYETEPPSRRGTRMTRIVRIFTDPRVSASSALSVFYHNPSAFICVYLRLIFVSSSDRTYEIQFELFSKINEKINNEIRRTPYKLTQPWFLSVRISSLFSRCLFSCLVINQSIWRNL